MNMENSGAIRAPHVTIHIGATKTGSSALQALLFENRVQLEAAGVLYPDIGVTASAHHLLFGALHPSAWRMHKNSYDLPLAAYFQRGMSEIFAEAQARKCSAIVLSSEYLWGIFDSRVYTMLRESLGNARLRIIACLREQKQWTEASYLQALKSGETMEFPAWFEKNCGDPLRGFNHTSVLRHWQEGLQPELLEVVPYKFDDPGVFIKQMFNRVTGIDLSTMTHHSISRISNPSPNGDGMRQLLEVNRAGLSHSERISAVGKIMKTHRRPVNSHELYFANFWDSRKEPVMDTTSRSEHPVPGIEPSADGIARNWGNVLVCPTCGGGISENEGVLNCQTCGGSWDIIDGIPSLMARGTRDTFLDLKSYAEWASVTPKAVKTVYDQFNHAISAVDKRLDGSLLEIGTGTGLLTEAMLRHAQFERIVSTDVSIGFLRHTRDRLAGLSPTPLFIASDGNVLPLRRGDFDVVLGRSVLHHLLYYRQTLSQIYELLRPGGVAAFFEPVQSGKAIVAFLFRVILGIEEATGSIGLSSVERSKMHRAVKGMMKSVCVEQTIENLEKMEDKYVFDIEQLCEEARNIGFEARFVNVPNVDHTYFSYLRVHLRMFGINPEVDAKLGWLKGAFGDTIGATARERLSAPMGYFVFVKPAN